MHAWRGHNFLLCILVLVLCSISGVRGAQKVVLAVRSYRNYVIDRNTGFLRRISSTVNTNETAPVENKTSDRTMLEAVPYSLEQLLRAYGHALLDHSWSIHEIAPVVHLNMIWPGETNRPISLPCWAPAQSTRIRVDQTTLRSHQRVWYIGQGNTLALSAASSFGYRQEPSSKALQVTPFMGLRYQHSVFTCALSRQTPPGRRASPKVSFSQTHMLYFQTTVPDEELAKSKVRVTAQLGFEAYAPDSDSPACNTRLRWENRLACPDSPWMQIDPIEQNITRKGYRLYRNKKIPVNQIPSLLSWMNQTIRDFCRIYSCVISKGPTIRVQDDKRIRPKKMPSISEFYRDHIVLEGKKAPRRLKPLGLSWRNPENLPVTYDLPGNQVLNISVEIRFSNEMIDCNMVQHLIEPEMGDLQQTAHYLALENEPAAPLSKMLQAQEMAWLRTRERTDMEKYRPTMCLSSENRDRVQFGDPSYDGILPFDGFTAIFIVTNETESSNLVEFNVDEGACELQVLCKNRLCTISLSMSHTPLYELPIQRMPNGGIHEFIERNAGYSSTAFILVAHPVRKVDGRWKQFLSVYRNLHRVTDGDAEIDPSLLHRRCGGNSISTTLTDGSTIKLLNWPAYELSGPSEYRSVAAYERMILPCNKSFTGIPYNASGEPYQSNIHPNNEIHIHFAFAGLPCSGPCESGHNKTYPALLQCYTTRKREPCTKEFYIPITREIYDLSKTANSPLYSAFAMQYCSSEYVRIYELGASQIASQEARSCNISGQIQSLSKVLECTQDRPIEDLKDKFDAKQCKIVSRDRNYQHRLALDAVRLQLKPVLRSCKPFPDVDPLFSSYKRPNDYRVYMRTYERRKCPIGYRKEKSVDNYTCTRCPADSYADITTELNTCQGCPMTRPSTYYGDAASSAQCSNDQLNTIRGRFFRYDTSNATDEDWESSFDISTRQWWHFPYNKFDSLEHLKPNETYLESQRQAVSAFLAMTQLTFSDTEVFLLLVISTSLAVFGGVSFMLLLAATNRPPKCPVAGYFGPQPSFKERIGLAIYCSLCKIALMIRSVWRRLTTRVIYETKRVRQSVVSHRFSQTIPLAGRRLTSLLRRQWEKKRLPPLTDRQKALIHLVTQTTIDRIVEAAERDLAERRERRRIIREEQRRRRQEVGEIESEVANLEAMAAVAKREAEEAELRVADAMDSKSRMVATQAAEEAKQRANSLASRASEMRQISRHRLEQISDFNMEEEIIPLHTRRLSIEDEHAISNAAPELRAFLRLPRYHTAAYFLLHPAMHQEALQRKTAYPAPERDYRRP